MKNFVILEVQCYTADGMELCKFDEDMATDHVEFKEVYIDFDHIESIQRGVKDESLSVVTMSSGNDFIIKGTPKEILREARRQTNVTVKYINPENSPL